MKIDDFFVWLEPCTCSSILFYQALRLDDRKMQVAPAGDVVLVSRNVLALLIGMDAGRKTVDLPKAVVAGTPRAGESPAAREL